MKTGLVVEGGGMKCVYSAGILDRFIDEGLTFDECIGVSAGAANTASFVAGQRGRNLRYYVEHPKDPKYCGVKQFLLHGNYFNLQYIYGDLTNEGGRDPLDYDAVMKNPAEFFITATDADTGEARYFSKTEMPRNDYRAIMAGCAIPALCKPVSIDGHTYYDGGVADSIPIDKALSDGCDKVVVILENPRSFVRQPQKFKFAYHLLLRKHKKTAELIDTRYLRYRECLSRVYELERAGKIFVFAPPENTGVSRDTVDPVPLTRLYETGIADFDKRYGELLRYLGE